MLGLLLCALATLFAVEAKVAWYGPDNGGVTQISASKLQPSEAPRLIAQVLSSSNTALHFTAILVVAAAVVLVPLGDAVARPGNDAAGSAVAVGFSPQVLFRPPPTF